MRVLVLRLAAIWLGISALMAADLASAQAPRSRPSGHARNSRTRLARYFQESPTGPQVPRGADTDFEDIPLEDGGNSAGGTLGAPDMGSGGNTAPFSEPAPAPAQAAPLQPEAEEEIYEPLVPEYAGEYETAMTAPPNDFTKKAITQYSGPRDWYTDLSFAMYNRSRPSRTNFAFNTVVSGGSLFFVPIFGTEDFDYAFNAGGKVTIGRGLWVDAKQRDHALELTYVGVSEWNEDWTIDRGGGTALTSGFDVNAPTTPFDQADRYHLQATSDMQSYELNYVIRRRLERDRLVYSPTGVWRREAYPGWRPAVAFGARYLSFDDAFVYTSSTNTGTTVASGEYRIATRNSMAGVQMKGELMYQTWRYSMGVRGGATGCANFSEVNAFLAAATTSTAVADITPRTLTQREQDAAVIGEFSALMNYRITDRLSVHGSWDMYWLGGISLAPEALTYNVNIIAQQKTSGFTLVQGGSLGVELSW